MATKSPETTFQASKMSEVDQLTDKLAGTVIQQDSPFCVWCNKHEVQCTDCKTEWMCTCKLTCFTCDRLVDIKRFNLKDGQRRRWIYSDEVFDIVVQIDGVILCGTRLCSPRHVAEYSDLAVDPQDNFDELKRYQIVEGQRRRWDDGREEFAVHITSGGFVFTCDGIYYLPSYVHFYSSIITEQTTTISMES